MNIGVLGLGGAGNRNAEAMAQITDKTIGLNNMYEYMFLNSNRIELFKNKHVTNINSIQLSQNGAGQDKIIAKKMLIMEKSKILNFLNGKLEYLDRIIVISSLAGGTGSTSIPIVCKLIKKIKPSIDINFVGISPDVDSTTIELDNSLTTYQDIIELNSNKTINSTMMIDNSKMYDEEPIFNKKCMELVLKTYEVGKDSLDATDLEKVSSANDYKIIMLLDKQLGNIHTEIKYSLDNSPFILNSALSSDIRKIQCTHIAGVLNDYTKQDVKSEINATMFSKIEKGEKDILILSGLKMPNEHFNAMQDILLNLPKETGENIESDFKLKREKDDNIKKEQISDMTEKEKLLSLLDDDDIF